MDRSFGIGIIDRAEYGVLSMVDGDMSYGLPLSIVRSGEILYFHSAREGRKVDVLANNGNVSVVFVGNKKIPENYTYDELEEMIGDPNKAIKFISSVFTTEFESAIVEGVVERVEDRDEKIAAMRVICQKYTPTKMKYFDTAIRAGLDRTNVYRIGIKSITAKRKKYDEKGEEMKWGRTGV